MEAGESIVWSCVFPMRKDLDLPAEAFLHLPQKQKFKPSLLLEKKIVEVTTCAVASQPGRRARLVLGDASEVKAGEAFTDVAAAVAVGPAAAAAERLDQHRPTPLDLEIELQEEVFVDPIGRPGERKPTEEGYDLLPMNSRACNSKRGLIADRPAFRCMALMEKLATRKQKPAAVRRGAL